jgi:hypothetical protein
MTTTTFAWADTGNADWGTTVDWNNAAGNQIASGCKNNAFINLSNVFDANTDANFGSLTINGGNLLISDANQTFTASNNRVLSPGNITLDAATAINAGGFAESGGTYTQNAGALNIAVTLNVSGGTFKETGGQANAATADFGVGPVNLAGNVDASPLLNVTGATGAASGANDTVTVSNSNNSTVGTIDMAGGTLTITETVNSGVVPATANGSTSTLNIAGTATGATAITLSNANQTLEVGNSGGAS